MSGGGKGGSQTTQVEIPDYLEQPLRRNIARAEEISSFGPAPYSGPVVAAMTPMQEAAMRNTSAAANAYGLESATGQEISPQPQTFAGGVQGYSTMPLYEQALAELQARSPAQYEAMTNYFMDPVNGEGGFSGRQAAQPTAAALTYLLRFHRGLGDMVDGGGPQASTIGGRGFAGPNPDGSAGNDGPGGSGGGK